MNNPIEASLFPALTLPETAQRLRDCRRTLILCHVNPDGDTVGSAYALRSLIGAMGGEAQVACSSEIPKRLRFLCGECAPLTPADVHPENYDTIFAVDVASPMQLGELESLIPHIHFMIDHHGIGEPFAPHYVDSEASAAGEIVYRLAVHLEKEGVCTLPPEGARRMYAAIVSDTGSFKFSNTTPATHHAAADLVARINGAEDGGMDTSDVCRSLFGQRTLKELTAQMLAIQNLRFYEDGRLGAVLFTQQMLADAGLTEEEIGNVVDTPRGVEGVLVGISLRQLAADPTGYKVSSRANGDVDCAKVCATFGGGGHIRAAGCTITADSPEEALAIAVDAFSRAIRNNME